MLKISDGDGPEEIRLASEPDVRVGRAWLRPAVRSFELGGHQTLLEPRVVQVIAALARQPNTVVSRDTLVDLCWGGRIVGEDAINRCIAKARKASAGAGVEIVTVPKVGYKLVAPDTAARHWLRYRRVFILTAVVLIGLGGSLLWSLWPAASPEYPPIEIGQFTTSSEHTDLRLRTADVGSKVADTLLRIGIPTVRRAGPTVDDSGFLVRGEISSNPSGIRALIQLDDRRTRSTIFSRELNLDADEGPQIADKIAAAVADAVTRTGTFYVMTEAGADRKDSARFLGISMRIAAGDYLEAEVQAKQFVEDRPQSRLAPFALSIASIYALQELPIEERAQAIVRARRFATLARERLPNFGDAYIASCGLHPADHASCEATLRRALVIDSSAPTVRTHLALLLMNAGRIDEASTLMSKAIAENPFSPANIIQGFYVAQLAHARSEETYVWSYAERYWPRMRFARQRYMSLMANGRWLEAEKMLPLVLRISPDAEATLRVVFTALHEPTARNKDAVQRACSGEMGPADGISCLTALSMLGRANVAVDVARRFFPKLHANNSADRERLFVANGSDPGPFFFVWGDGMKALRADPGFADLAEQVGLLDFWRTQSPPDVCKIEATVACRLVR